MAYIQTPSQRISAIPGNVTVGVDTGDEVLKVNLFRLGSKVGELDAITKERRS
jgi:hypothetical protein